MNYTESIEMNINIFLSTKLHLYTLDGSLTCVMLNCHPTESHKKTL